MKEQILHYLETSTKQRRVAYLMTKEPWYPNLDTEFNNLKLPPEWKLQRKLWHYWNNTSIVPKCPISGQERRWREGAATERLSLPHMTEGYSQFANYKIAGAGIKTIARETLKKQYGVDNPMDLPGMAEKRKNHFIEKYGVENPSSNEQVKQKRIKTMLDRHGVAHNFVGWQEKLFTKFGVYNPAHIPDVAEKLCYNRFKKRKEYVLSTGEIIQLQGYEPYGFDYLKTLYKEEQILYRKRDMPALWYEWDSKTRRYYCDFFVPAANLVVEIKSLFTLSRDFDIVRQKILAAHTMGYKVSLLVFDQSGDLIVEKDAIHFLRGE